jgi:hypothetical protein
LKTIDAAYTSKTLEQGEPSALLRSFYEIMPKKLLYRLGEYRITDYENGRLSWERHVDFGVQRSGDGYILGGAIILGPGSHEENGFLIG